MLKQAYILICQTKSVPPCHHEYLLVPHKVAAPHKVLLQCMYLEPSISSIQKYYLRQSGCFISSRTHRDETSDAKKPQLAPICLFACCLRIPRSHHHRQHFPRVNCQHHDRFIHCYKKWGKTQLASNRWLILCQTKRVAHARNLAHLFSLLVCLAFNLRNKMIPFLP